MTIEENIRIIKSNKKTLYATSCNWCTIEGNQFGTLTSDNFVPIKGKSYDGEQAVALYCADCLKRPERVADPKSAFIMDSGKPTHLPLAYLQENKKESVTIKPDVLESLQKHNIVGDTKVTPEEVTNKDSLGTKEEKKKKSIFG